MPVKNLLALSPDVALQEIRQFHPALRLLLRSATEIHVSRQRIALLTVIRARQLLVVRDGPSEQPALCIHRRHATSLHALNCHDLSIDVVRSMFAAREAPFARLSVVILIPSLASNDSSGSMLLLCAGELREEW